MRRREFISLMVGAATAWPRVSRAQQSENLTRIGFLPLGSRSNRYDLSYVEAFQNGLIDNGLIIQIIGSLTNHGLAMVCAWPPGAREGAVIGYGPDYSNIYRRAGSYISRILKGEKPSDLPVQNPIKFQLVINQNAARALGVNVPPSLIATADEVIE